MDRYEKQQGFTLIELMATLGLLALIIAIAVPAIGSIMNDAEAGSSDASKSMIEEAGQLAYLGGLDFDTNERYYVTTLVGTGYLNLAKNNDLYSDYNFVDKQLDGTFKFDHFISEEDTNTKIIEKAAKMAYLSGLAFDDGEQYEVSTLARAGFLNILDANRYNRPSNYVERQSDGTFAFSVDGFNKTSPGSISWTIPLEGTYLVEVAGGQGGQGSGGDTAKTEAYFQEGDVLSIQIGGRGSNGTQGHNRLYSYITHRYGRSAGGGGGSSHINLNGVALLSAAGGKGGNGVSPGNTDGTNPSGGRGGSPDGHVGGRLVSYGSAATGGSGGGRTFISDRDIIDSSKNVTEYTRELGNGKVSIIFIKQ